MGFKGGFLLTHRPLFGEELSEGVGNFSLYNNLILVCCHGGGGSELLGEDTSGVGQLDAKSGQSGHIGDELLLCSGDGSDHNFHRSFILLLSFLSSSARLFTSHHPQTIYPSACHYQNTSIQSQNRAFFNRHFSIRSLCTYQR